MDRNFALAVALSLAVLVVWATFIAPPTPPTPTESASETGSTDAGETLAEETGPGEEALSPPTGEAWPPTSGDDLAEGPLPGAPIVPEEEGASPEAPSERVRFSSELVEAELTTRGAGLVRWALRAYPVAQKAGSPPVDLVDAGTVLGPALATPFDELGDGDWSRVPWELERLDANTVVFERSQNGALVRKTYHFDPESYLLRLQLELENGSSRTLRPSFRIRWPVAAREGQDFRELALVAYQEGDLHQAPVAGGVGFLGFGASTLEEPQTFSREVDWAGSNTRYFLAALLPEVPRDAFARFVPVVSEKLAATELAFAPVDVPPGQRVSREYRIYVGPKEPERLDGAGAHLAEAIQRGWFPSLTRFFAWLLHATYDVVPNYGVAIILITALVRILMAPIMARQMKSMKRMGELQPRIKEIQARYPDDRQKQSEAMMSLYREAGVSPFSMLAGCFPMLLQLPVFIGFYFALQGSIDLRQQPFMLWIQDLSAPEALFVIPGLELPLRVLPLLMGGSMVLQQKLSPTAMDPAQARMMMVMMPIMFTVLFYQFASGLVLYWLVSNLLGIAQQVWTNRSKTA